jgi:hypothetical protein
MKDSNQNQKTVVTSKWAERGWLRNITGWAFLAAAVGAFLEAVIVRPAGEGTIGLIPLYFGIPIGSVGLVLILRMNEGWMAAILAAAGFAGFIFFMVTYPDHPEGWIGLVLVGTAHLFIPFPGRLVAVLWIAAGILAFPEFYVRPWGMIDGWNLFTVAAAASGLFILWGKKSISPKDRAALREDLL